MPWQDVCQLIFNLKRSDHITDALVSLHWLRVPERIQYKIAVLSYKYVSRRSFIRRRWSETLEQPANSSSPAWSEPWSISTGTQDASVSGCMAAALSDYLFFFQRRYINILTYLLTYLLTKFFTIPRRDTWDHSLVSPTYLVDEHSALPAPIAWKYLISNFPSSAAELFRLPPHRSGTHYQTQSFRHQHCGRSSTNWKLFYFNDHLFISTVIVVSQ